MQNSVEVITALSSLEKLGAMAWMGILTLATMFMLWQVIVWKNTSKKLQNGNPKHIDMPPEFLEWQRGLEERCKERCSRIEFLETQVSDTDRKYLDLHGKLSTIIDRISEVVTDVAVIKDRVMGR